VSSSGAWWTRRSGGADRPRPGRRRPRRRCPRDVAARRCAPACPRRGVLGRPGGHGRLPSPTACAAGRARPATGCGGRRARRAGGVGRRATCSLRHVHRRRELLQRRRAQEPSEARQALGVGQPAPVRVSRGGHGAVPVEREHVTVQPGSVRSEQDRAPNSRRTRQAMSARTWASDTRPTVARPTVSTRPSPRADSATPTLQARRAPRPPCRAAPDRRRGTRRGPCRGRRPRPRPRPAGPAHGPRRSPTVPRASTPIAPRGHGMWPG
jgi:hypothetical protein